MKRIYLVPGIYDTAKRMQYIRLRLILAGYSDVHTIEIEPSDGSLSIEEMAIQILRKINTIEMQSTKTKEIVAIGFSMGGIVLRYVIQRLNGKELFSQYFSIASPHNGTIIGYLNNGTGVRQMRPTSELLRKLQTDQNPWGNVKVYSYWTLFDMMIIPAYSSILSFAVNKLFPVPCHPCMTKNKTVVDNIIQALE